MAEARVNIMLQRPLLRSLRLLTAKYFEVFCAETIPLIALDQDHAESVYGPAVRELLLNDGVAAKLIDVVSHENRYWEIVAEVRKHLAVHHNYRKRLQELVAALTAPGGIDVKQMQSESKTHERI
jgi:hypothetical protein